MSEGPRRGPPGRVRGSGSARRERSGAEASGARRGRRGRRGPAFDLGDVGVHRLVLASIRVRGRDGRRDRGELVVVVVVGVLAGAGALVVAALVGTGRRRGCRLGFLGRLRFPLGSYRGGVGFSLGSFPCLLQCGRSVGLLGGFLGGFTPGELLGPFPRGGCFLLSLDARLLLGARLGGCRGDGRGCSRGGGLRRLLSLEPVSLAFGGESRLFFCDASGFFLGCCSCCCSCLFRRRRCCCFRGRCLFLPSSGFFLGCCCYCCGCCFRRRCCFLPSSGFFLLSYPGLFCCCGGGCGGGSLIFESPRFLLLFPGLLLFLRRRRRFLLLHPELFLLPSSLLLGRRDGDRTRVLVLLNARDRVHHPRQHLTVDAADLRAVIDERVHLLHRDRRLHRIAADRGALRRPWGVVQRHVYQRRGPIARRRTLRGRAHEGPRGRRGDLVALGRRQARAHRHWSHDEI